MIFNQLAPTNQAMDRKIFMHTFNSFLLFKIQFLLSIQVDVFWDQPIQYINHMNKTHNLYSQSPLQDDPFAKYHSTETTFGKMEAFHTPVRQNYQPLNSVETLDKSVNSDTSSRDDARSAKIIRQLEEQLKMVQQQFDQSQKDNQSLSSQLYQKISELNIVDALLREESAGKGKLEEQLMQVHDQLSKLQREKAAQRVEPTHTEEKHLLADTERIERLETEVADLWKKLKNCEEELMFEKAINTDLRKELAVIHQQLQRSYFQMQDYDLVKNELFDSKKLSQEFNQRLINIQDQLHQARMRVDELERDAEDKVVQQNRLFLVIEEHEAGKAILKDELGLLEQALKFKNEQLESLKIYKNEEAERSYRIQQDQNAKIEELLRQMNSLNDRNLELEHERDVYFQSIKGDNNYAKISPKEFLTILKHREEELNYLKNQMRVKQDEIAFLESNKLDSQISLKKSSEELRNALIAKEVEARNRESYLEAQLEALRRECQKLAQSNSQLAHKQARLQAILQGQNQMIMSHVSSPRGNLNRSVELIRK